MSIYHSLKNKDLSDKEIANMTLLKLIRPNEEISKDDKFTLDEYLFIFYNLDANLN